ncbi:Bifunctional protein GlmU [Includes: UDP-N-acetylglucosamine pyrophosphorylase; Glucosamine-1-phosphate N-acetyltransferase] (fragment) [uncultured Woeseiaceae bacterium]|uniref:Bifunctional protein GlmU n=1 Tax=uncultured Woeseiaceae bacterium TaxID=1983305 RepID=A0A7D9H3I5_9GAMM
MNLSEMSKQLEEQKKQVAQGLLDAGVILDDWTTLNVTGELTCAPGVRIAAHVVIEGAVKLGSNVQIGPYNYLKDSTVSANTEIRPFSSLESVEIGENCRIGPYARIRDRCVIARDSSVGNFVELKATKVGASVKINHLAFLGDTELEADIIIGAGVITCNYDGTSNVKTKIEQGAFVGCGTELVAPITVGRNATIGAGSTVTHDVDPDGLTLARSRQVRIDDWHRKST